MSESPPPASKTRKKKAPGKGKGKEKEPEAPTMEYCGHFRDASIGLALIDTLDDWITAGKMSADLANRILANFDETVKVVMEDRRHVDAEFRFEGTLKNYRCLNGNWELFASFPRMRVADGEAAPAGCNLRILAYASTVGDDSRARQKRDHWGDY